MPQRKPTAPKRWTVLKVQPSQQMTLKTMGEGFYLTTVTATDAGGNTADVSFLVICDKQRLLIIQRPAAC